MNESGRPTENSSNFYFEPPDLTSLYNVGQSAENGADVKYSLEIADHGPIATQEWTIGGELILKPAANPEAKIHAYREAKIEAYNNSDLPEIIGTLKEELASCNPLEHPSFVDRGIMSAVYSIHDSYGEHLAVRLKSPISSPQATIEFSAEHYIERFTFGEGNPILEQPVAASVEDQAVVSPFIPGNTLKKISTSDLQGMNVELIAEFANGIWKAASDGIWFDQHGGNFMYTADIGFTAIDYAIYDNYTKNNAERTGITTLETIVDSMFDSDAFDILTKAEKYDVLNKAHTGIEASELPFKNEIHSAIDSHGPASLTKRFIDFIWT